MLPRARDMSTSEGNASSSIAPALNAALNAIVQRAGSLPAPSFFLPPPPGVVSQ